MKRFLAFDFGASSVRAIVGNLENNFLKINEIYRFSNKPLKINRSLYWDLFRLYEHMKKGLKKYVEIYGPDLEGIGVDTWGLDFVLLDKDDEPIGPFYCYRDKRTEGMVEQLLGTLPKELIFEETGIQFISVNSSTQMFSMTKNKRSHLDLVKSFLMVPDYINFLLSGKKVSEFSIATTSQLFNPVQYNWSEKVITSMGIKNEWFMPIINPGDTIGNITPDLSRETGLSVNTKIIAPLCHDTGSAVAAVPVDMKKYDYGEWAYISSGTWSLMGVELERPLINQSVLKYNFTNEGGVNRTIRFLKNITGLWLLQECKRIWDSHSLQLNWQNIEVEAKNAEAFKAFIDPNDERFINPENMINAIQQYCKMTNQYIPQTIGEIARTIFESLALKYKEVLDSLEILTSIKIKVLHVIGGGSKNSLLNQFTANILDIPVITGPTEATAIGNLLIQALGTGIIMNISELRTIVNNSFNTDHYRPQHTGKWDEAFDRFLHVTQASK
ncbi:MAG: Rhamnulokinase [Promethearchaeota archaeon]|nr:MAG: Rhamnulokinase [Candidatus Lokiarchaeota archaeon]